jgi:hypothetical protein
MYRSLGGERKAMKKFAVVLSVVIGAWLVSPTPEAQAWSWSWSHSSRGGDSGCRTSVPELDPSSAGGAMVLLLGGAAYIASRRREEDLV